MLYTTTQNQTDIHSKLRGLYGTRFVFNTTTESDLDAMRAIDPALAWTAKELVPYHFIDVTFRTGKDGILPVFEADPIEIPAREAKEEVNVTNLNQPRDAAIDYAAIVREKITNGEVVWVSGLAKSAMERSGADRDAAKLKFRNILLKLLDAGETQVQRLDDPESGERVSLYFAKGTDENEGPLHRWMVGKIVESCGENIKHVASSGEALPDVETESRYLEVETGLKRRTDDLEERVAKFGQIKPVVIVVPNEDVAEAYNKRLAGDRATVKTLREFLQDNALP